MSRFATPLDENMIEEMMRSKIPDGTKRKERWAITLFRDWMKQRNNNGMLEEGQLHVFKEVDELSTNELNYLFSFFILEIRTCTGSRFKSSTLKNITSMIQYHYNKHLNKGWSIFKDKEFQRSRNSLDLSMKLSRESGVDGNLKRAEVIEETHDQILWNKNLLGSDTPTKLVHTLVYLFGKNFALRGRDEHRRLQMSMIEEQYDHLEGRYFLLFTENISKTSRGGIHDSKKEPKKTRAYENQQCPDRCIVQLFRKYLNHRPQGVEDFYLTPLINPKSDVWFKVTPMGVNQLANVVKQLFQNADIKGHFTNHSLKRTARSQLCADGFGRDVVVKKTGHISESDLDYLVVGRKKEIAMSDSINYITCTQEQTSTTIVTTDEKEIGHECKASTSNPISSSTISSEPAKVIIEKNGCKVTVIL